MSTDTETIETAKLEEPVTKLDEGPANVTETLPGWSEPFAPVRFRMAEDLLSAHLALTAPDRDGLLLPMAGEDLREDSIELYHGLQPKTTMEAMLATLAVGFFNSSLTAVSDGTRRDTPLQVRDINLRHAQKGAKVTVELLNALNVLQKGGGKRVSVGAVNVAAGGQAIVGNVEAGKRGSKAGRQKKKQARNR